MLIHYSPLYNRTVFKSGYTKKATDTNLQCKNME